MKDQEAVGFLVLLKLAAVLMFFSLAASCTNDAIVYAQLIAPDAKCKKIRTSFTGDETDTAVCRVGSEIWACSTSSIGGSPRCEKVADVKLEKTP